MPNEGVFSWWKGHSPTNRSAPAFFRVRYCAARATMSVRALTASMSSSRMRPATGPAASFATTWLQVSFQQPAPGKEEPFVRAERVPVRHARDVVGHAGRQIARGLMVLGGQLLGVVQVVAEQVADQLHGLLVLAARALAYVDLREHEVTQGIERREDRR